MRSEINHVYSPIQETRAGITLTLQGISHIARAGIEIVRELLREAEVKDRCSRAKNNAITFQQWSNGIGSDD